MDGINYKSMNIDKEMIKFGASVNSEYLGKSSTYKHVYIFKNRVTKLMRYMCSVLGITKNFTTEREAALFADKILINHDKEPVNILKRKP